MELRDRGRNGVPFGFFFDRATVGKNPYGVILYKECKEKPEFFQYKVLTNEAGSCQVRC